MCLRSNVLALILTLACLHISILRATSVVAPSFSQLVSEAQVIARVEVTAMNPAWVETPQGRVIKTFVTFAVKKAIKGAPASKLTLSFLGGELDGKGMRVEGMPRFMIGQTDIIFVSDLGGTQFCPLVGLMHGRFRVRTDAVTAHAYIARDDGTPLESLDEIQLHQAGNSSPKSISRALSLETFEQKISTESNRLTAQR